MAETKHTKGKLEINKDFAGLIEIDGETIFVVMPSIVNSIQELEQRKANGKELLRRWNSHNDLLKACKAVSRLVGDFRPDAETMDLIEAAIAKAELNHA